MADDQAKKLETILEKLKEMDQKLESIKSNFPITGTARAMGPMLDEKTLRRVLEEYGLRKG